MKEIIDLVAPDFSADISEQYSLSIRQIPDGYSFCVLADKNSRCIAVNYKPITKGIKPPHEQLKDEPLLQLKYKTVIFVGYGAYAVVPKNFVKNNHAVFLPISQTLQHRAEIIINSISSETEIVGYTNQWKRPDAPMQLHHETELLISLALRSCTATALWSEIMSNHINIVIKREHKLILCNTYDIATDTDASYFILACYQQFALEHETIPLYITGTLHDINPVPFLSDYIRHIHPLKPNLWNNDLTNNNIYSVFTLQTEHHII